MKCNFWKPCSEQCWQDELWFLIWRFFEQSAFVTIHLLCYRPTIHISISKICPKFQGLSSHFSEINELPSAQWAAWSALAKIVPRENISTPLYVKCYKMYWSKVCVQTFWYIVSSVDIQLEQSEKDSPLWKKISCRWRNTKSHIQFFQAWVIDTTPWLSAS